MKMRTIWTLRNMSLKERLIRSRECGAMFIGRNLPKEIRYWTTLQELAKATVESKNIPATPLDEVLQKLDGPR